MPCIHTRIIDKNNLMMKKLVKKFSSNLIDDDFFDTLHLITIEKIEWIGKDIAVKLQNNYWM